jgi:hypothetical protein
MYVSSGKKFRRILTAGDSAKATIKIVSLNLDQDRGMLRHPGISTRKTHDSVLLGLGFKPEPKATRQRDTEKEGYIKLEFRMRPTWLNLSSVRT